MDIVWHCFLFLRLRSASTTAAASPADSHAKKEDLDKGLPETPPPGQASEPADTPAETPESGVGTKAAPEAVNTRTEDELLAVTSTNYRKEYHVLKRIAEGPRAVQFPNIAKAFNGTKQEQRDVLKTFLLNGGNLDQVEASVQASRTRSDELEGVRELLTLKQMRDANFTEFLASFLAILIASFLSLACFLSLLLDELPMILRAKIQACVARGGVPDDDCPTDVESMRFWCATSKKQTSVDKTQVHTTAKAMVSAPAAFAALESGFGPGSATVPVADPAALIAQSALAPAAAPATPNVPGMEFFTFDQFPSPVKFHSCPFILFLSKVALAGRVPKAAPKRNPKPKPAPKVKGPLGMDLAGKTWEQKVVLLRSGPSNTENLFSFCHRICVCM